MFIKQMFDLLFMFHVFLYCSYYFICAVFTDLLNSILFNVVIHIKNNIISLFSYFQLCFYYICVILFKFVLLVVYVFVCMFYHFYLLLLKQSHTHIMCCF